MLAILSNVRADGGSTYVVDRLSDANPTGGGEGSALAGDLRYAISNAQSGDSITFSVAGTINLAGSGLGLSRDVSIQGPGANKLTVHGYGGSVFAVGSYTTVVILSGLTITGGVGNGAGIFNNGTLTLNNVTVSGNTAEMGGLGGGIWNYTDGILTLNNSTVSGNSALPDQYGMGWGGGIANYGTLTLNNSTVSGNIAAVGGGIFGAVTLNSDTVSRNTATEGIGGGIATAGTTATARNTIIAGNTGSDFNGTLTSRGYNLIGDTTGGTGFRSDLGDLLNVDPLLGPLTDNGGPTLTHLPLSGSPAIGAADPNGCKDETEQVLTIDQRNQPRLDPCTMGSVDPRNPG